MINKLKDIPFLIILGLAFVVQYIFKYKDKHIDNIRKLFLLYDVGRNSYSIQRVAWYFSISVYGKEPIIRVLLALNNPTKTYPYRIKNISVRFKNKYIANIIVK